MSSTPVHTTPLPRGVLAASFLSLALVAQVAALGPAAPGVAARLGVSLAAAGMLVPLHSAGALAGILWWGRAQGRVPSRRLLVVGTVLLLGGALLVATNPGAAAALPTGTGDGRTGALVVLLVGAVVLGLGFGLLDAGVNTVVTAHGASTGLLNALHGAYGLAAIGYPLLVGLTSLRLTYVVVALGCLGLFAPLRRAPDLRRPPADGGAAARRSRPWMVMIAVAMGVEVGTAGWAAAHLVGLGRSEAAASTAVAGFFAAFTASRFLLAPVADRFEPARLVRGGLLLAAGAAVLAWLGPWPAVAWCLVGIGIGPVFPTALAWLVGSHQDDRAATRLMVGGALGGTVLPAAVGGVVAVLGTVAIPPAIAGIAVLAWSIARRVPAGRSVDT